MTKEECYYLGRVTKPFGFKGEMVLFLDVDEQEDYAGLDSVFVETKNGLVPYFIKSLRFSGNKAIATFEDPTRLPRLQDMRCTCRWTCCLSLRATSSTFTKSRGFAWLTTNTAT